MQEQPGLEAVKDRGSDKHVATTHSAYDAHGYQPVYYEQVAPQANPNPVHRKAGGAPQRWLFVGVAVLIAILAGTIGGIIGWKVTESQNSNSLGSGNDTSPAPVGQPGSNGAATTGAAKTILKNSALSVTGYRYGADFNIKLFYQGPDNQLRYSVFDTVFSNWSMPQALLNNAAAGTPIATTIIWQQIVDVSVPRVAKRARPV